MHALGHAMINHIRLEEIDPLAINSTFLRTDGGGDHLLGWLLCREAVVRFVPVRPANITWLEDSDSACVSAAMGAPTIMSEKLLSLEDRDRAVRELENYLSLRDLRSFRQRSEGAIR